MLENIVDRRKKKHHWRKVNAIAEPTWHHNSQGGDQADSTPGESDYDELEGVSLGVAVIWAQNLVGFKTLFIYDEGDGTTVAETTKPNLTPGRTDTKFVDKTETELRRLAPSLKSHLYGKYNADIMVGIDADGFVVYVPKGWRGVKFANWKGYPISWNPWSGKIKAGPAR